MLAQGASSASDIFNIVADGNTRMDANVIKNMDDLCFFNDSLSDLEKNINEFLKFCQEKNLKLKTSKFNISQHVEFAGFSASIDSHFTELAVNEAVFAGAWISLALPFRGGIKLVTMRCNRRNNEISHCYNLERIRCNSYKLFYATILLQHLIVVTILLHRINDVTIRIGCNSSVKHCNNVKFKYLLLQRLRNVVTM